MEPEISHNTFISTASPRRRKKRPLTSKRIMELLSPIKHSMVLKKTQASKSRRRKKRRSKKLVPNEVTTLDTVMHNSVLPNPLFDCTIDLSADDSVSEPQSESATKNVECVEDCIVLSDHNREKLNQREIIDLTTNPKPPDDSENQEPTVIDLSDNDDKSVVDNEVFVIGTYKKNSSPKKSRKRRQSIVGCTPLTSISSCSTSKTNINETAKKKRKKASNKNKFEIEYNNLVKSLSQNTNFAGIDNVYTNSPVTLPSSGLRPIIIDGSNVAFEHANAHHFSCKRLEICIKYFKEKGHKVTAFVPQYRLQYSKNDNPNLLRELEKQGDVVLTPSKTIDGRRIVPYDDRFIVQTAVLKGGIIVSRDNYNDLLKENPAWAETIKYRVLAFTWVDDVLMFPKDPLGVRGPSLEEFLRF